MPRTVTIEEQVSQGLRRPATQYITPYHRHDLTASEREVLGEVVSSTGTIMAQRQQTHHAHSDDTALTNAFASLFYSIAYAVAGAMITGPLLVLTYFAIGGDKEVYLVLFLLLWGCCLLVALGWNRWQGLWHSTTGLAHHEIDSRERIAKFVVKEYIGLLEKKWNV